MAVAAPMLKIGQGFGTWLIPVLIFGVLATVAIASLVFFACSYSCRSRRKMKQPSLGTSYEIYRMPTTPYRNPSSDRLVDPIIGRLIRHSRSLHVVSPFPYFLNRRVLTFH